MQWFCGNAKKYHDTMRKDAVPGGLVFARGYRNGPVALRGLAVIVGYCDRLSQWFCCIARGSCFGLFVLHCEGVLQCRSLGVLIAKGSCNGLTLLYWERVSQ